MRREEFADLLVFLAVAEERSFTRAALHLSALRAGLGLAFVFEDVVAREVEDGRLVRVLEDWWAPFAGYDLYYPSRRQPTPAFRLLVEALRYGADSGRAVRRP